MFNKITKKIVKYVKESDQRTVKRDLPIILTGITAVIALLSAIIPKEPKKETVYVYVVENKMYTRGEQEN